VWKRGDPGGFVAVLKDCCNHKKPPATTHAIRLTVALEAATLSFELWIGGWQFWCLGERQRAAQPLFFLFWNAPYLTQLIKVSQRKYQTSQHNFVKKPLLSSYSPEHTSSPHLIFRKDR
jgi:hypothetical protein